MTQIINLTPHAVTFMVGGEAIVVEPSGKLARLSAKTVDTGERILGIPVTETVYGEVDGLPDPQDGVVYVVSSLVAGQCKGRQDVLIPAESIRDSAGRITGCKSLGRV